MKECRELIAISAISAISGKGHMKFKQYKWGSVMFYYFRTFVLTTIIVCLHDKAIFTTSNDCF